MFLQILKAARTDIHPLHLPGACPRVKSAHSFAKRKTDPKYLATIALVHFHSGDVDEAIEWQRKAYFSAREKDKEQYKFTLDSYRMQQLHASAD